MGGRLPHGAPLRLTPVTVRTHDSAGLSRAGPAEPSTTKALAGWMFPAAVMSIGMLLPIVVTLLQLPTGPARDGQVWQ
jgi:hypothetical protein